MLKKFRSLFGQRTPIDLEVAVDPDPVSGEFLITEPGTSTDPPPGDEEVKDPGPALLADFRDDLSRQHDTQERIAQSRIDIDMCRLLVLKAAYAMDTLGNKEARQQIAMIKVAAPNMALQVIDWAMQVHGGGAMSQEFPLAYMWALMRALRFADGPDEVHRQQIARLELRQHNYRASVKG